MNIKHIANKDKWKQLIRSKVTEHAHLSYSKVGEDLIVAFLLESLKMTNITYLDIGANFPKIINNTYMFYERGSRGICIEPNPKLFKMLEETRPEDTCLNFGIGPTDAPDATLYVMENNGLSTFSKKEAEYVQKTGTKIERIINVPLKNINTIIREYCKETPNLVSIDIEGMDVEIISTFDFKLYRPQIFVIETITYSPNLCEAKKIPGIFKVMEDNGYIVFADTFVNTIFVDKKTFEQSNLSR